MQIKQLIIADFFTVPCFQFAIITAQCEGFAQIPLDTAFARIINDSQCLRRRGDEMIERLADGLAGCEEMLGAMRDVTGAQLSLGIVQRRRMRLDEVDVALIAALFVDDEDPHRGADRELAT